MLVTVACSVAVSYFVIGKSMMDRLDGQADSILTYAVNEIIAELEDFESAAKMNANFAGNTPDERISGFQFENFLKASLGMDENIIGSGVFYEPGAAPNADASGFYAYRDGGGVQYTNDYSGNMLADPTDDISNFYEQDWYKNGIAGDGKPVWSDAFYYDPYPGTYIFTVSVAFRHPDGRLRGVGVADVSIDNIAEIVDKVKIFDNGRAFVIGKNGEFLTGLDGSGTSRDIITASSDKDLAEFGKKIMSADGPIKGEITVNGERKYSYIHPLPDYGWRLVADVNADELSGDVFRDFELISVAPVAGLLLMMFFVYTASRYFSSVSNRVNAFARKLIGGGYGEQIEIFAADEFGTMAQNLNALSVELKKSTAELLRNTERERIILERSPNLICTFDERMNVTNANENTVRLLGYKDLDDLKANFMREIDGWIDVDQEEGEKPVSYKTLLRAAFAAGGAQYAAAPLTIRGKEKVWLNVTVIKVPQGDGYELAFYATDITNLKNALKCSEEMQEIVERQLREQYAMNAQLDALNTELALANELQSIVWNSNRQHTYFFDENLKLARMNQAVLEAYGYKDEQEAIDRWLGEVDGFVLAEQHDGHKPIPIREAFEIARERGILRTETAMTIGGRYSIWSISIVRIPTAKGYGVAVFADEITELRSALKTSTAVQNRLKRHEKLLSAINSLGTVLFAQTETEWHETIPEALEIARVALDADRVSIWRNITVNGRLFAQRIAAVGHDYGADLNAKLPYDVYLPDWLEDDVLDKFTSHDTDNFPYPKLGEFLQKTTGTLSHTMVPLVIHGAFWGLFAAMYNTSGHGFTTPELRIFRQAGLNCAAAIRASERMAFIAAHNAVLTKNERMLEAMNRLGAILFSTPETDWRETMTEALTCVKTATEADIVAIWRNVAKDDKICALPFAAVGIDIETFPPVEIDFEQTLPDWTDDDVAEKYICHDVKDLPYRDLADWYRDAIEAKAAVLLPIMVGGEFWGVFALTFMTENHPFSEPERRILRQAGLNCAAAVIVTERNQSIIEATMAKSTFLSQMSHEIRTPLNAIMGMTQIGQRSSDFERKEYAFEKINEASAHLLGVINDILDISKIEAGKFELANDEFDLERAFKKASNIISFRASEKRIQFTVDLDKNLPRFVIGDDQRFVQVLLNLLSNAVKFTDDGGKVEMSSRLINDEDGNATIETTVEDTGIGITDEQKSKLFGNFIQVDAGISRRFGGTGLGLAISKHIANMRGGDITVVSEPGKGSAFTYTVTLKKGTPREETTFSVNRKDLRILTVDDEQVVREYFLSFANEMGLNVETASDGETALGKIAEKGGYDIYFIDWLMPGINGLELARRIRQTQNGGLVIMFSGADLTLIEKEAKDVGVTALLPKPLFSSDIIDCINKCAGEITKKRQSEESADFAGKTVLIAEDVEVNQIVIEALLEETGIEIDFAENGIKAVELFRENSERYNAIFMDVHMPEMDGYEATRQIRALDIPQAKTVPIIAMTANVFREDVERCLKCGMNDHIGKPVERELVIRILKEYL
jgi:signal transduction histidine kinase/CheY-like chemotaxis protein/PAS domain-containing protein